jgi:hypothetical protein
MQALVYDEQKKRRPRGECDANIAGLVRSTTFERMNSGVFVANRTMLTPELRKKLIDSAVSDGFQFEQEVIERFFGHEGQSVTRAWLAPWFNFHAGFLARLSVRAQLDYLAGDIRFLHYIGRFGAPWRDDDTGKAESIGRSLWRSYAKEAAEASSLFRP